MLSRSKTFPAITLALTLGVAGQQAEAEILGADEAPADRLVRAMSEPQLQALVEETLARNPAVARRLALARATENRVQKVKALPDPVVGVTAWLKSPETRTGPQILTLNLSQNLPWLGKFDLEEQATLVEASALYADVEALRLELLTTVRELYYELAFLTRYAAVTRDFLDHLRQHEEIAQSRYATGVGSSQDVIKIQADITLTENLLLDIDRRRIGLEREANALRDRPASAVILPALLPASAAVNLDYAELSQAATLSRPEVIAADARIAANGIRVDLAHKQYRPDFGVGLTYTFVDPRRDAAGRELPPEGNGEDILGIQGAISIPIWRRKRAAGVEEASQIELSAREAKRGVLSEIEAALGDLLQRIPLTWQQLRLLEDILLLQAEESVQSAHSAYVSGRLNALDLLDAEHVLFEAETAVARASADYAIGLAQLEGAVGRPLQDNPPTESSKP